MKIIWFLVGWLPLPWLCDCGHVPGRYGTRGGARESWISRELDIEYTPSLVFFDGAGKEIFRTEGYLKSFHFHGAMDYVATEAYLRQPNFQRYLQERRSALEARGIWVDLME